MISPLYCAASVAFAVSLGAMNAPVFAQDSRPVVTVSAPQAPTSTRLERISDSASKVEFVVEGQGEVAVHLAPKQFPIKAGQLLSLNTSFYDPTFVRATQNGVLDLKFVSPLNCTVVIEDAQGGNLLPQSQFDGDTLEADGWVADVHPRMLPTLGWGHEGMPAMGVATAETALSGAAPGNVTLSSLARSGAHSVRLQKGAGQDSVAVTTREGIAVEAGRDYVASGYYHTVNPRFGSNLVFIAKLESPGKETQYLRDGYLSPLIYTTPAQPWRRSFTSVHVPDDYAGARLSLYVAATGTPFESDWDDFEICRAPSPATQYNRPLMPSQTAPRVSPSQLLERLSQRQPVESKVVNGRWLVNGRPIPLLGFTSQPDPDSWPVWSAHNDFFDAGIKLTWVPAPSARLEGKQFSQFGPMPWQGDGKYDFSAIDNQLQAVLLRDPDALVGLYASISPDEAFGDRHPDAVWTNARGEKIIGEKESARGVTTRPPGHAWNFSYTAPTYRLAVQDYLRALGRHLAGSPYGKAVCALHLGGGTDAQWFPHDWTAGGGEFDYSPGALASYHAWLQGRYKNDLAAFQRAWNDPQVTFSTATLPTEAGRSPEHYFLDPRTERKLIDANFWRIGGIAQTANLCARAFKDGLGRPTVVTTYFHNKHDAWATVLNSPDIDGFVGVPEYGNWRQLGRDGEIATYPGSIRLHNKFYLMEMDYRTENSDLWGGDAHNYSWMVVMHGADEAAQQMRRDYGAVLAQGDGAWLYSLPGNTWATPAHMSYVREVFAAAKRAASSPMPSDGRQIAVFSDEDSEKYDSRWNIYGPIVRNVGNRMPRVTLDRSGLSWDHYLLSDLGNPKLPDYKMYVFLTSGTISPSQIAWVQAHLHGAGKVALWVHDTGVSTYGVSRLPETSRALTGMTLGVDVSNTTAHRYIAVGRDPLAEDADNTLSEHAGPLFYVNDPKATPLAYFTDAKAPNGSPLVGMAVVRGTGPNGKWTSVYSSLMGGFSPRLLRNLAREAGLTPVGPEDDVTFAGNGFLTLHALTGGQKTLHWTGKSDLVDLTSGQVVAHNAQSFSFPMEAQTTRWFRHVASTR